MKLRIQIENLTNSVNLTKFFLLRNKIRSSINSINYWVTKGKETIRNKLRDIKMELRDCENTRLETEEGQLEDPKLVGGYFKTLFINMAGRMKPNKIA